MHPARTRTLRGVIELRCTSEIPYTVRRSSRARRVRVNVHAHTERRGGAAHARARARRRGGGARAAPVDRAAPGGGAARRSRASPRARAPCPTWASSLELVPAAGAHARASRGERCSSPTATPRPAIERFYRRAARAGDRAAPGPRDARSPACATAASRSARSARAGPPARPTGAMSFNWRLLLAPERVLDYVVWHEVCHLRDARPLAPLLGAARAPLARTGARTATGCARNGATLVL